MTIFRKKPKYDTSVVEKLVHAYLWYIRDTGEALTCSEISETMRYAMCVAQGLETKGYSERVESLGVGAIAVLESVLESEHLLEHSVDVKRGLLEACVQSLEAARKRVLEVGNVR